MVKMKHCYEKLDENTGKIKHLPQNDFTGTHTGGKIVINLPAWMDENEDFRKSSGWIRHEYYEKSQDIFDSMGNDFDPATQYLIRTVTKIDDYTVRDAYHAVPKTEQMAELEEMLNLIDGWELITGTILEVG